MHSKGVPPEKVSVKILLLNKKYLYYYCYYWAITTVVSPMAYQCFLPTIFVFSFLVYCSDWVFMPRAVNGGINMPLREDLQFLCEAFTLNQDEKWGFGKYDYFTNWSLKSAEWTSSYSSALNTSRNRCSPQDWIFLTTCHTSHERQKIQLMKPLTFSTLVPQWSITLIAKFFFKVGATVINHPYP